MLVVNHNLINTTIMSIENHFTFLASVSRNLRRGDFNANGIGRALFG